MDYKRHTTTNKYTMSLTEQVSYNVQAIGAMSKHENTSRLRFSLTVVVVADACTARAVVMVVGRLAQNDCRACRNLVGVTAVAHRAVTRRDV